MSKRDDAPEDLTLYERLCKKVAAADVKDAENEARFQERQERIRARLEMPFVPSPAAPMTCIVGTFDMMETILEQRIVRGRTTTVSFRFFEDYPLIGETPRPLWPLEYGIGLESAWWDAVWTWFDDEWRCIRQALANAAKKEAQEISDSLEHEVRMLKLRVMLAWNDRHDTRLSGGWIRNEFVVTFVRPTPASAPAAVSVLVDGDAPQRTE